MKESFEPEDNTGRVIAIFAVLLSLPGAFFAAFSCIPESFIRAFERRLANVPSVALPLVSLTGLVWFTVLIFGPILALSALILDGFLIVRRKTPLWLKLLATIFLIFAVIGTLLIESQANHVRH